MEKDAHHLMSDGTHDVGMEDGARVMIALFKTLGGERLLAAKFELVKPVMDRGEIGQTGVGGGFPVGQDGLHAVGKGGDPVIRDGAEEVILGRVHHKTRIGVVPSDVLRGASVRVKVLRSKGSDVTGAGATVELVEEDVFGCGFRVGELEGGLGVEVDGVGGP